ncbi:hypothetical protein SEA_STEPHIG9_97 [Mycobacterium phage Stephig9]|uniref:Uncharacterized protein n=1 Tax=Mycobacterium phage Stephig9 TaxID=2591224 RepID=A0A514DHF7_9CAUD|nr:hypothetical protein SEA_STEPHIG9_97 [Mycobacterium phage Stephig9]
MSKRFIVKQLWGHSYRNTGNMNWTHAETKDLAESTVRQYIRELKGYASGFADYVSDNKFEGCTKPDCDKPSHQPIRVITAHHFVNGFENIRELRITPKPEA